MRKAALLDRRKTPQERKYARDVENLLPMEEYNALQGRRYATSVQRRGISNQYVGARVPLEM